MKSEVIIIFRVVLKAAVSSETVVRKRRVFKVLGSSESYRNVSC